MTKNRSKYKQNNRNSKIKELQNEFDNYKRKNTIHVNEVLKARNEVKNYQNVLMEIIKLSTSENSLSDAQYLALFALEVERL